MLQVEKQRTKVADTKPLDYIFTNAGRTISDEEISSGAYRFDPQNVMCHASFSSSNNSFLCIGKDFYDFASKFYEPPSNSFSDFQVWFTTNGVQHIIPLYYDFYLELSFIYNYGEVLKKY
ncbi:hypothetical protein TVAG_131600 [Trichomonas vaginalis G3]|uniref:Uncharacterized protein n=1 Tax=Trichomonas vaginalis (strain ATCC PRA-98 / G3) TaxID=412133 RepID=A2GTL9_TRIV3|nr:hypothetical protein TVAGG3_0433280 [Trichomonas vaginalis G3]EAX79498.1 hypothetical protein TVAG_131600 [Trichomonas vaginalis G3]KAI5536908.1 hypothetical protein TVAGG3_0433280 [Trichomonas vaginalis G3]|eukprot:XP_001292428.1 hypothetical protein [Trichomonas vaginalis G3]